MADKSQSAAQTAVRVRAPLLDRLVNQAGEVSITRSRIESEVGQIKGSLADLTENLERLRQQLRDIELQAETQMSSRLEAAKAMSQSFDPLEFGVPPTIVPATDTAQLLALLVARAALQAWRAGPLAPATRARTSVILGVTSGQELLGTMVSRLQRPVWVKALRELGWPEDQVQAACRKIADHYVPWVESTFPGLLGNVVAGRIANRLDFGGTNCIVDAACASSFGALHLGVMELQTRRTDLVLTGGVDCLNDIFMHMCFSKTPALSPTGDARPFSDKADGTLLGEGLGVVVLKRLDDAIADADRRHRLGPRRVDLRRSRTPGRPHRRRPGRADRAPRPASLTQVRCRAARCAAGLPGIAGKDVW